MAELLKRIYTSGKRYTARDMSLTVSHTNGWVTVYKRIYACKNWWIEVWKQIHIYYWNASLGPLWHLLPSLNPRYESVSPRLLLRKGVRLPSSLFTCVGNTFVGSRQKQETLLALFFTNNFNSIMKRSYVRIMWYNEHMHCMIN